MKKTIKAIYILLVAIVVFMGALLIAQGLRTHEAQRQTTDTAEAASGSAAQEAADAVRTLPIDDEAGSAI